MAVVEEGGGGDATPTSEGEAASLPHHHHHHLHPSGAVSLSAAIQRISSQHNVSIIEKLDQRYLYPLPRALKPGLRIHLDLIRIRIQFYIQGFDDQKLQKILNEKN
jgi:hypothetical protein